MHFTDHQFLQPRRAIGDKTSDCLPRQIPYGRSRDTKGGLLAGWSLFPTPPKDSKSGGSERSLVSNSVFSSPPPLFKYQSDPNSSPPSLFKHKLDHMPTKWQGLLELYSESRTPLAPLPTNAHERIALQDLRDQSQLPSFPDLSANPRHRSSLSAKATPFFTPNTVVKLQSYDGVENTNAPFTPKTKQFVPKLPEPASLNYSHSSNYLLSAQQSSSVNFSPKKSFENSNVFPFSSASETQSSSRPRLHPSDPVAYSFPFAKSTYQESLTRRQSEQTVASIEHDSSDDDPKLNAESPSEKAKFKDFHRQFWVLAKDQDANAAHQWAVAQLEVLPRKIHWRMCMEVAELAKRHNDMNLARTWYAQVNTLEPHAAQGWLERAKLEEECGELGTCQQILDMGLSHCKHNESLLVKVIKHRERMGDLDGARAILGSLQHVDLQKVWKPLLEGGLMEARAGNVIVARRVFKYLMKNVPWYGPVYYEASRMEERMQEAERAYAIASQGIVEVPHYGPLWYLAMRLSAKTDGDLEKMRSLQRRAVLVLSSEMKWKVYFEAAQIEEKAGFYERARDLFANAIPHCPKSLCWKIWLCGARLEIRCNRTDVARSLLSRAMQVIPKKMRAAVMVECSRLEENSGNVEKARSILERAKHDSRSDWKVFLEAVLLELRCGNIKAAITEAQNALQIHQGTGRLWALLIQLSYSEDGVEQQRIFKEAIKFVPKSGEVWCEGARMALNPLSANFNLKVARRYIQFAINFTPQYGDTFIEFLRLKLLVEGENSEKIAKVYQACLNAEPNYGSLWFHCKEHCHDTALQVLGQAEKLVLEDLHRHRSLYERVIAKSHFQGKSPAGKSLLRKSPGKSPAKNAIHPDQRKRWEAQNINSLHVCYPIIQELTHQNKHKVLFGSDPIT